MPEKSSEATPWIILGVGIVIGSVFAYFMVKAQQVASSSTSTTLPGGIYTLQQPAAQPSPPDTEFMKWYADKIIKPAIESTAKYAVKETLSPIHSTLAPTPAPMAPVQTQALTAAEPAPQPQQLPPYQLYKQDIEFIKWYTETIIKPSIQQAARESAQNAIRQFMENQRAEAEVQTLGSKTAMPRAKTGNWMITRDSEGAIVSIETMKNTPQKEPQSIKPAISLCLPDKINMGGEHRL